MVCAKLDQGSHLYANTPEELNDHAGDRQCGAHVSMHPGIHCTHRVAQLPYK